VISAAQMSYASFDLMLLGDNTTAGSQRVQRYDPVNRINLGTFGQGYFDADIQDIAVDSASKRAYVIDNTGFVRYFNYNTGDYLGGFTTGTSLNTIAIDPNNGRITASRGFGGNINPGRVYDANGTFAFTLSAGTFATSNFVRRIGDTTYFSWGFSANPPARRHNATTGALIDSVGGPVSSVFIARSALMSQGGRLLGLSTISGNLHLYSIGTNISGFSGAIGLDKSFGASTNVNVDMVNGHNDLIYMLNGSSVIAYDTAINRTLGTQNLTFASAANIRGMGIVLAPEPGTMAALGLGLVALLRRKNRVL